MAGPTELLRHQAHTSQGALLGTTGQQRPVASTPAASGEAAAAATSSAAALAAVSEAEASLVLGAFGEAARVARNVLADVLQLSVAVEGRCKAMAVGQEEANMAERALSVLVQAHLLDGGPPDKLEEELRSLYSGFPGALPLRPFLLWQLLLVRHGGAEAAMRLLEERALAVRMRIAAHGSASGTGVGGSGSSTQCDGDDGVRGSSQGHTSHSLALGPGSQTFSGGHQVSCCTLSAQQELSAVAHCYVHDVVGGALGRWRDVGTWLAAQPLMRHDANALAAAVAERMDGGRDGGGGGAAVQQQRAGQGSRPAGKVATARPADAAVGAHANSASSMFTMTGDMECGGSNASTPRLVGSPGPAPTVSSALDGGKVAGSADAAPMLRAHASGQGVPSSTGASGTWIGGVLASVFAHAVRGTRDGMPGTSSGGSSDGAYGMASRVTALLHRRSRELLSAVASVVMLFALVAERRSLSIAVRRWWRQLRAALRDLMSMGLVLTPSTG